MPGKTTQKRSNAPASAPAKADPRSSADSGPSRSPSGVLEVIEPAPKGGGSKKAQPGCQLTYRWDYTRLALSAAIGDSKGPTRLVMSTNGPVPMAARAEDTHIIIQECGCPKARNKTTTWLTVDALIRYEWLITAGGGGFVPKTGGRATQKDSGQQVIYQPPDIDRVYPDPRSIRTVRIQVMSKHHDPSKPPMHGPCVLGLTLTIARMAPKQYVYKWGVVTPFITKNPATPPASVGDCKNAAFAWQQNSPIQGFIVGPRRCAPGDYVRFEAKANDTDSLVMRCLPGVVCTKPTALGVPMSDTLNYEWMSTRGKFVKTPTKNARHIVWKAPSTDGFVDISVRIIDSGRQFVDPQLILSTRIEVKTPQSQVTLLLTGKVPRRKKRKKK